jgi:hypothetical protein
LLLSSGDGAVVLGHVKMVLAQVTTDHYCAGLVIEDDHVIEAAPIIKWTIGWHRYRLLKYFRERGDKVEAVW